ncbi:hypothetical protein PS898_04168 [Pseudomonas fluorescens]|nr:hypothetical protein PS898_04168 [Pseudomonas fluorescens]
MPIARSETELSESLASQLPQCVASHNKSVFNTSPCGSGLARDGVSSGNKQPKPYPTKLRITKNKTEGPSKHPSAV